MSFPIPEGREPFVSIWRGPELVAVDNPNKVVHRGSSLAQRTGSKAEDSDTAWARMPMAKTWNKGCSRAAFAIWEFPHSRRDPPPLKHSM